MSENEHLHVEVEPTTSHQKLNWFEPVTAILMALTTLSTAWCSYETSKWNGASNDSAVKSTHFQQQAALMHMEGNQALMVHVNIFMQLMDAQMQGNDNLVKFYTDRLSPDMRKAYEGWLAQKPFENTQAAPHPFVPGLYKPRFTEEVKQANVDAAKHNAEAKWKGNIASQYLSNTVLLAAVLFFAGTSGKFHQRRVRHPTLVFAVVIYLYTVIRTFILPIA